ncbi:alpha/beta hydrolase [Pseudoxanthomonas broegbernensis]|uniref:Alpha/beta hydrolase n=1 Tax=Pseudoxanthomonas broegbernensis TaxID=83619 RepID=A0A7V8GMU0_9GAMM|nr:alpha/beta hydrolase [Pseudoxanthomonas broegbernensis]KAF1686694.1 alpha/beta hydrolase [Pseudoxanthomonas broegbernensis]MBB6063545.1 pimeloyl-ACP methyl ester carboxylesterase [Pseudoxanthomonas broegbernensis]
MQSFKFLALASAIAAAAFGPNAAAADAPDSSRTTVILVHGAFAESASWDGVVPRLAAQGYRVVAAANPLRSVAGDAESIDGLVEQAPGPVVLVGHSYGGAVISNARANSKIKALVYVAAFAPDQGESVLELTGRFPGSTLPGTLAEPVQRAGGGEDLYIRQDAFWQQFAADVPQAQAAVMAATQRPVAKAALVEASGQPRWKEVPSWFVYGDADRNIPAAALQSMADRAGSRGTVVIPGASHVVMTSQPQQVAALIGQAAEQAANR